MPTLSFAAISTKPAADVDVQEIFEGLSGADCGAFLSRAVLLSGTADFRERIPPDDQAVFYWQVAVCAVDTRDFQTAFTFADRTTAIKRDVEWPQVVRMYFGTSYERPDASLEALDVLSRIAPERVRKLELDDLNPLLRAARNADATGDRLLTTYEALDRSDYAIEAPYDSDHLRLDHARLLLERGRTPEARALVGDIDDVEAVVEMRVDRLFDPLRGEPAYEVQLDVAAAMERQLARSRAAMAANPKSMEAVYLHTMGLVKALKDAEGLAVADETLARYAEDRQSFDDGAEYKVWLINMRGYFLYGLGRSEEGRAALRESAGLEEHGELNVSNIINFGIYLINEGRASEAFELIPKIGEPSPFGQGWIEVIRTCAGAQLDDAAAMKQGLDWFAEHEDDNPAAKARGLLCAGDVDAAAALMIRRLENRKQRKDALFALQVGPATAEQSLPYARVIRERFAKVREREDVRAAVEKVGRIETLPVDLDAGE